MSQETSTQYAVCSPPQTGCFHLYENKNPMSSNKLQFLFFHTFTCFVLPPRPTQTSPMTCGLLGFAKDLGRNSELYTMLANRIELTEYLGLQFPNCASDVSQVFSRMSRLTKILRLLFWGSLWPSNPEVSGVDVISWCILHHCHFWVLNIVQW